MDRASVDLCWIHWKKVDDPKKRKDEILWVQEAKSAMIFKTFRGPLPISLSDQRYICKFSIRISLKNLTLVPRIRLDGCNRRFHGGGRNVRGRKSGGLGGYRS